ncbi:MAG TPA: hypothetical protein QF353_02985 [Gammaproteobacteria bacterium]|nr:hypothetical protein [Gammaproteobacteria bacterium]
MGSWSEILFILLALFLGYSLYRSVKHNPELYSSENMHKSLWTVGLLSLGLMAFIGVCVLMLRAG